MQTEAPSKSVLADLQKMCAEAINHQIAGRLVPAEKLYREILCTEPRHATANHCLGMLYVQLRQPQTGLPHLLTALEEDPKSPNHWLGYLEALLSDGQTGEATSTLELALKHGLEGHAVEDFARRLGEQPLAPVVGKSADAQVHQGRQGRSGERRKHRLAEKQEAQLFALVKHQRFAEAMELARTLTELQPERGHGFRILGALLYANGNYEAALGPMQVATRLLPEDPETHVNLGATLNKLERLDEAELSLRRALELDRNWAAAHVQLGNTYQLKGQYGDAESSIRGAISLQADAARIGDTFIYSMLLFLLSHNASVDADSLFAEHCRVGAVIEAPARGSWPRHANVPDPERRLRVGFVSGDLRNHAIAQFVEPLFAQLKASAGLELHAYFNNIVEDAVTRRMREYFTHWNPVSTLDDAQLAKRIMDDGIDILIDLSGHTSLNRLWTFARKPAPVQASWLGYPATTGLEAMDYYLTDRHFSPPGRFDRHFTEKLAYLPAVWAFQPSDASPPVHPPPALASGHVTFGSFNRLGKINEATVRLWSRLMGAVPGSRMIIAGVPLERRHLQLIEWFGAAGIARDRLTFHPYTNTPALLILHQQVDIVLETIPYTGCTTSNQALWMGVPTLTLTGDTPASRLCAANLGHLGLDEFIADSPDEFVATGLRWAHDPAALGQLRAGMRERWQQAPARDPAFVAAGIERALRHMWRRWCAGLPAESFELGLQPV